MISIVVAADIDNGIKKDNKLLCHLPKDMKMFKNLTIGSAVVMGRKTWDSLPKKVKPLSYRVNIVISKSVKNIDGCIVVSSIVDALAECNKYENVFVIGGGEIYNQMLPFATLLYITRIYHSFEADAFFPEICTHDWQLESSQRFKKDDKHKYEFSFEKYKRIHSS